MQPMQKIYYGWSSEQKEAVLTYRAFPEEILAYISGYGYLNGGPGGRSQVGKIGGASRNEC